MVKERVSATIDKSTIKIIDELLKEGNYRNKSHIIEDAIKLLSKIKKRRRKNED